MPTSPGSAYVLAAVSALVIARPITVGAQSARAVPAISVAGSGPETYVMLTGLVGRVAGFRRLEARLLDQNQRVIIIDPYHLSIDSTDVSFAALARRVERVLDSLGVTGARVVGHAHGGGVALRLAANAPERVGALYLLDVGALPDHRSRVFGRSLRLVPLLARIPGGRGFIRRRFMRGLKENSARDAWIDSTTERAYTEPMLDEIDRVIRMAVRLGHAEEPESLATVVGRIRVPVTVMLGDVPHPSGPVPGELTVLEPLGSLLRVERIPGVGHFPHEEAPDELLPYLLGPRPPPPPRTVPRAALGTSTTGLAGPARFRSVRPQSFTRSA